MKIIYLLLVISSINFNALLGQNMNPYRQWDIEFVGEIIFSDFVDFIEMEEFMMKKLGKEDLCNTRMLANIPVGHNKYYQAVFFKYCPYEFPIVLPKVMIYLDSCVSDKKNIEEKLKLSLDSLSNKSGTKENNYAIFWSRKYDDKELTQFFKIVNSVYSKKYANYRNGSCYYDFPLMFFSLSDWVITTTELPKIEIKFVNDSIIVVE